MSEREADDLERLGYFLPEDGQHRLKKLCGHMEFLSHLAQPRMPGEQLDGVPEIQAGELAVCLELLAEQAARVLDEVSWPARRETAHDSTACDERDEATHCGPGGAEAEARFAFGVTLDQIDALDRLVQTMSACGDVMTVAGTAELSECTVPQLGQAACDAAAAMRDILDQVEGQRLGQAERLRDGVREVLVQYVVRLGCMGPHDLPAEAIPSPFHRLPAHVGPPGCVHLH